MPISIIVRLIPIEIPKKYKIEASHLYVPYNRFQVRILLVNWLQEELDQPDLRPRGEVEEELVTRDREAPLGGDHGLITGLRIRIHFIRIRIQHVRLNTNPDPDPIRIQGFNDQKLKKN